jgi:hypothetical protein
MAAFATKLELEDIQVGYEADPDLIFFTARTPCTASFQ